MGSKTPGSKVKQASISCEVCDMKFQTPQALRMHKSAKHQRDPLTEYSPESAPKVQDHTDTPSALPPSRTSKTPSSRTSQRLQKMKNGTRDTEQSEKSEGQNSERNLDKIEFACPECNKVFPMYFQALKHIEKKHPGEHERNSETLKPVRVEKLLSSNMEVGTSHGSNSSTEDSHTQNVNTLYCLGCESQFGTIGSFNKHALYKHCEDADNMFFKNHKDFHMWKQVMETQVKIKYIALKKSAVQTYYHCNYVSLKNEQNKTYLCPSLVFVKYLQTGLEIRYGKKHYGHNCPDYELPDKFSRLLTNQKQGDKALDDTKKSDFDVPLIKADTHADLLNKFQYLMGNITEYASKLSIPHLRKLFDSALQMQGVLNSFDDDESGQDAPLIKKSMTDVQITNALEGKRTSARLKRKSETRASVDAKKKKYIKSDPDENVNKTVFKENKEFDSPNVTAQSSPLLSPSFVDSFKQFIGEPTQETPKKSKNDKRKEIVKTKIGQFSPKKQLIVEETVEKKKQNIHPKKQLIVEETVEKKKHNILPKKQLIVEETVEKKKKQNILPKKQVIVEETIVKKKQNILPKKQVIVEETEVKKKQNILPKKQVIVEEPTVNSKRNILKPTHTNTSISLGKDIKYEVREQDNDCNILILKI